MAKVKKVIFSVSWGAVFITVKVCMRLGPRGGGGQFADKGILFS
jgi:hypothetical protein